MEVASVAMEVASEAMEVASEVMDPAIIKLAVDMAAMGKINIRSFIFG